MEVWRMRITRLKGLRDVKKKGEMNYIVPGLLAVFVLWMVLYGFWDWIAEITFVAKLLPGFNSTASEGTNLVGINLENRDFFGYFTGESWRAIKDKDKNYILNDYEFLPSDFNKKLTAFYNSERRPQKLVLEVNSWRYWEALSPTSIILLVKKTFRDNEKIPQPLEGIYLDYHGNAKPLIFGNYFPSFMESEINENQLLIKKVVEWRDSILENNKCEKFLTLSFKENGVGKTEKYTVRKLDNYVFVDLSKPIIGGKKQEWDKEDCFGFENYDDEKNKILNNVDSRVFVDFIYTRFDGSPDEVGMLSWKGNSDWDYTGKNGEPYQVLSTVDDSFYQFLLELAGLNNLFHNLEIAFNYERNDQGD